MDRKLHETDMYAGYFWEKVNGILVSEPSRNLVVAQGRNKMLKVHLGADAKIANWYIALWSNATDPLSTWTAANFAANAGENVSTTEGYSGANRIPWLPVVPTGSTIDNVGQEASFSIVCTTQVTFTGAALLSEQARGSTSGILHAAKRWATARTLQNGDTYEVGYAFELTSS